MQTNLTAAIPAGALPAFPGLIAVPGGDAFSAVLTSLEGATEALTGPATSGTGAAQPDPPPRAAVPVQVPPPGRFSGASPDRQTGVAAPGSHTRTANGRCKHPGYGPCGSPSVRAGGCPWPFASVPGRSGARAHRARASGRAHRSSRATRRGRPAQSARGSSEGHGSGRADYGEDRCEARRCESEAAEHGGRSGSAGRKPHPATRLSDSRCSHHPFVPATTTGPVRTAPTDPGRTGHDGGRDGHASLGRFAPPLHRSRASGGLAPDRANPPWGQPSRRRPGAIGRGHHPGRGDASSSGVARDPPGGSYCRTRIRRCQSGQSNGSGRGRPGPGRARPRRGAPAHGSAGPARTGPGPRPASTGPPTGRRRCRSRWPGRRRCTC